jgi:hypothetical protein
MKFALAVIVLWIAVAVDARAYEQEDLEKLLSTKKCVGCDLSGAQLDEADLVKAHLARANLTKATLFKSKLNGAYLAGANLTDANLTGAHLTKANLRDAILTGATVSGAFLDGANLNSARLIKANLTGIQAESANLTDVELAGADLEEADLTRADLSGSNLNKTNLFHTILTGSNFQDTTVVAVRYEPLTVPRVETLSQTEGLASLIWQSSPLGLNLLRQAFKNSGMRKQERQVTYSIKHSERLKKDDIEAVFDYILFEFTSEYGMSPGRPLLLLLALILVFSIPYMISIMGSASNETGVWLEWPDDSLQGRTGKYQDQRITATGYRALFWGLYFSFLSAFQIGWREFNIGHWIERIHPKEYHLRPLGWVKAVSGIQSLICVYLLAMWALTYFARPFE